MKSTIPFVISILFLIGCSSGNPITTPQNDHPIPESGISSANILGAYELIIDFDSMSADLTPHRQLAIGESWIVSGKSFFDSQPCRDCFRISGLGFETDKLVVEFSIRHPFEKGIVWMPPSGRNRLDLDIFDLAMVILPKSFTPDNFPLTNISVPSHGFDNPHGYTIELSGLAGTNTALPYFLAVDDSLSNPPSFTFNKFEMGSSSVFEVKSDLSPGQTLSFDLYLTFGYGYSATFEYRLIPTYYNPEFNRKAAWKVNVIPQGTTYGSTWDESNNTTLYDVIVKVYDWQIGANVNPALENSTDIYATSGVEKVTLEIPGMHNTIKEQTTTSSGTGMPDSPLTYTFSLANENALSAGEYRGLVAVYDERSPSGTEEGRDYLIHTPDAGKTLNELAIARYVTYQTFTATVVEEGSSNYGSLMWAISAGGISLDEGSAITVLSDNSMVICGVFEGSATFGKDEPNQTVLTEVANSDIFVARYYPDGTLAWAKSAGGTYYEKCPGITALSDNSVVVTGYFYSPTITFDKGGPNETVLMNHPGELDIFIARYNIDGSLAWAKKAGGPDDDGSVAITTLSDDSFVITGFFYEVAKFGEGEPNETIFNSPNGWLEIFIARYNPNGTLMWAKKAGGEGSDEGTAITALSDNSLIVSGTYSHDPAIFGAGEPNETSLEPIGWQDIFIARYNPDGSLEWAKRAGGEFDDGTEGITTLSDDSVVLTGHFSIEASFGEDEPNETVLISSGSPYNRDIFTARYNPDGSFLWVKGVNGHTLWEDTGMDVTTLADDSTIVTGYFRDSAVFGEGEPNETVLTSGGGNDLFLARYSSNGSLIWAKSHGGPDWVKGHGITTLSDNTVAVTGWFAGSPTFGKDATNETVLTSEGSSDIFIARFEP